VLVALASDDGQSQRELSARLGIHRNAMLTVIDNLERRVDADRQKRRNTKSCNSFGAAEPMLQK
jgi:DNA-binding MarR family transcriptional regulator